MLHALADCEHVRIGGAHGVVHHHAPVHLQAGGLGERHVRPDADGHDQEVAGQHPAVLQPQPGDPAMRAHDLLGLGAQHRLHPALAQRLGQEMAGGGVQLALHQDVHQVHDRGGHAAPGEAVGRLKAQEPPADHHRLSLRRGAGADHALYVVQVAEGDDAFKLRAGQGQADRVGAGGEEELVIGDHQPALGGDGAALQVDGQDLAPAVQHHAVVVVPGLVVDHDLVEVLLPSQDGREHDAVVVHPGLGPEDHHLVAVGIALVQLLHRAAAGHAVADHHEALLGRLGHHAILLDLLSVRPGPGPCSRPGPASARANRTSAPAGPRARPARAPQSPGSPSGRPR